MARLLPLDRRIAVQWRARYASVVSARVRMQLDVLVKSGTRKGRRLVAECNLEVGMRMAQKPAENSLYGQIWKSLIGEVGRDALEDEVSE